MRVVLALSLLLLGCSGGNPRAPSTEAQERITELCRTLRREPSPDAWQDVDKFWAGIEMGRIGLERRLPHEAIASLEMAASDDREIGANVDPVDGIVTITGLDMQRRLGDGARIGLAMLKLAGTASELERMDFLCHTYLDPKSGQSLRSFCMARLLDFEPDSVVPYLMAAAGDRMRISELDRRWCVLRLTEFFPVSADCLLMLTRDEDPNVAQIALQGIERFGYPRETYYSPKEMGERPHQTFDEIPRLPQPAPVRLLVNAKYERGKSQDGPQVERATREMLARLGLIVLGPKDSQPTGVSLLITVEGKCLRKGSSPNEGEEESYPGLTGAQVKGEIALLLDQARYAKPFEGQVRRIPHFEGEPMAVPYRDALLRSDFIPTLCGMVCRMTGKKPAEVLSVLLEDEDWRVCLSAAWAVRTIGDPGSVGCLTGMLAEHPNWLARAAAADALAHMALPAAEGKELLQQAIDALVQAVLKPDTWPVHVSVARALGQVKAEKAVEPIMQWVIKEPCWVVRKAGVRTLGRIGDRRAIEPLKAIATNDPDARVREEAAKALGMIKAE